jgi:two-component system chemotaxis response regulator CheB
VAKIKVVVVDDSALVRSLLTEIINRQPDMTCVGAAADPLVAREMIRETNPDVITLDVEMPRMDGLEFLSRLMRLRPMPVVMVSTLTEQGAETTLRALEMGAVDFVAKPRIGVSSGLQELAGDIVDKIRVAAAAHVKRLPPAPAAGSAPAGGGAHEPARAALPRVSTEKIICIGASTGGTEAIREVLMPMPADAPAIVITQHMPPGFTTTPTSRRVVTTCASIAAAPTTWPWWKTPSRSTATAPRWRCCSNRPHACWAPTRWASCSPAWAPTVRRPCAK